MSRCAVLTRFPAKSDRLQACAQTLAEMHSGLMASERDWQSTEVLIDEAAEAVLLLTHWSRDSTSHAFEATEGYKSILKRLGDDLTGEPISHSLRIFREREHGGATETDMAISGDLGS